MKKNFIYVIYGIICFIILFLIQQTASYLGNLGDDLFYYRDIDPYNIFARKMVHHIIQMFIALMIIMLIRIKYKKDFGFKLGDKKKGLIYVLIFTFVIATFFAIFYLLQKNITFAFPVNSRNVIGSLAFQLFFSGPSEEILFRALPITLFIIVFKRSIKIKWFITLEIILAALLFAIAHLDSPKIDFQIYYSFILGIIFGITYQKTNSVIYPMLMHSISNVISVGFGYIFYLYF